MPKITFGERAIFTLVTCLSKKREIYSMFNVIWTTFKFNRNRLGTVSAYVIWLWIISPLLCTFKWLSSIEMQCHKGLHLKPKAAINYAEISSLFCHWYQYNGENMTEDWAVLWSHLTLSGPGFEKLTQTGGGGFRPPPPLNSAPLYSN